MLQAHLVLVLSNHHKSYTYCIRKGACMCVCQTPPAGGFVYWILILISESFDRRRNNSRRQNPGRPVMIGTILSASITGLVERCQMKTVRISNCAFASAAVHSLPPSIHPSICPAGCPISSMSASLSYRTFVGDAQEAD